MFEGQEGTSLLRDPTWVRAAFGELPPERMVNAHLCGSATPECSGAFGLWVLTLICWILHCAELIGVGRFASFAEAKPGQLEKNIMGQLVMLGTFSFVYSFYIYTRQVTLHGQWSEAGE